MEPRVPEDIEQRNIIDKLAQFVARNGGQFEEMTKAKQIGNPRFAFLFGGEYYPYYQFKVAMEQAKMKAEEAQQSHHHQHHLPPAHHGMPPASPMGYAPGVSVPPMPPFYHGPPPPPLPPQVSQNAPMYPPVVSAGMPAHYLPPPPSLPSVVTSQAPPPMFNSFPTAPSLPHLPMPGHNHTHHQLPHHQIPPPQPAPPPPPPPEVVAAEIDKLRSQIADSERNLGEQLRLIEQEEDEAVTKTVDKALEDELKRMCEDYSINLNEFDKLLTVIEASCRKESIANGKSWIFASCFLDEHCEAVAKHLLRKITRGTSGDGTELPFDARLHLIYLINELYSDCIRKDDRKLREALNLIIVPVFCTLSLMATDEKMPKLNKLLKIWEFNQYLEPNVLDQLRTPETSLEAYQAYLLKRFEDQLNKAKGELKKRRETLENMHSTFVKHVEGQIQAMQPRQPTQPPPHMFPAMFPGLPPSMFPPGQAPPQSVAPEMSSDVHPTPAFGGHHNFYGAAVAMPPVPGMFVGPPPPGVFGGGNVGGAFGHPPPQDPAGNLQPWPQLSMLPQPPPTLPQPPMQQPQDNMEQQQQQQPQPPCAPYFDLPAGIMTMLVGVEDFGYKPIEIAKIRMPMVPLPDDRLLQALDAFYAPASHANPRNADGWEQLGLYEFYKQKSAARKEYEAKFGSIEPKEEKQQQHNKSTESDLHQEKENIDTAVDKGHKTSEPEQQQKRKYKQFKEEKETSSRSPLPSSTTKTTSSRSKRSMSSSSTSSRSSRSRSRSRSRSISPRQNHRRPRYDSSGRGDGKRRRSRSRSPLPGAPSAPSTSASSYRSSRGARPRSRSMSPPSMTKGLGSLGGGGAYYPADSFPGHSKPPAAPEAPSLGLYAGVGSAPATSSNPNDPFENYRRNKGAAYIRRIRDGRRE